MFNTDEFRTEALQFNEKGYYTKHLKGTIGSKRYWDEMAKRSVYGYKRPGGEWIPGYYYYYLNFSPIALTTVSEEALKSDLERIQANRTTGFPEFRDAGLDYFLYLDEAEKRGEHAVLFKSRGIGYEQPISEEVITPDGIITIGELKIGDKILNPDGNSTEVVDIFPQGIKDVYEVTLHDGRKVRCGRNHLWSVYSKKKRKHDVVRTIDIINNLYWVNKEGYKLYKYYLEPIEEQKFTTSESLPINPYLLGLLLGDGAINKITPRLATNDIEIIERVKEILGEDYNIIRDQSNNNYRLAVTNKKRFSKDTDYHNQKYGVNPLSREIHKIGLGVTCKYKFIPDIYKKSSIEDRYELIRGLLDSDGSINNDGSIEFTNTNKVLINDLAWVLRSLGIRCQIGISNRSGFSYSDKLGSKIKIIARNIYYRLYIRTDKILFNLTRKKQRTLKRKINNKVAIVDIKKLDYREDSICIMVNNSNHLYLTKDFIPTHNSFSSASMCNRNFFLIPGSKSFVFAESDEYLQGDGILTKAWNMMAFIDQNTAWSKRRQVQNDKYHKRASRKVNIGGIDTEKGFLSEIMGVPIGHDLDKTVRGKRGKLIVWEESGSNKYLLSGWMIALQSMAEGRFTFGLQIAGGTGGSSKTDMMSIETLFKKPKGYRVYAIPNRWEPGHEEELTGYFWPAHYGRRGHMDKDGNSNLESAANEILRNRKSTAEEGDPESLIQLTAEEPLTPSEAMLRVNYSIFNLNMIRERISVLETNSSIQDSEYIGRLAVKADGIIVWEPDDTIRPIRNYPMTPTDDFNGGIVIWEHPVKNTDGEIPYGLYIASTDPYDEDKTDPNKKDSLGSTFIMNVLTGRLVAEYTARPRFADDYYEQVRRLLKYYNAVCNYEQNKKGMYQYFNTMNSVHMLCDNPQILRDMDLIKVEMSGNRLKGTYVNEEINKYARELIKKWSESPAYGEDPNTGIKNIHKIKSLPLLYEMLYWEPDRNADRVSSLGLLMILKLERFKINVDMEKKVKTLAEDPLFNKLYTGKETVTGQLNSHSRTAFFDEGREVYDLDKY